MDSFAGLITAQIGMNLLRDASAAVVNNFKDASAEVARTAQMYVELRSTLQQVAALTGKANTGTFTADQARQAADASLTPQEWVKFQEQFQSYAGAYLEGDQQKISGDEATKYQQSLAQFAKARGVSPDQIAQLGGGILQFSDKELSSDQAMTQLGKQFKTLERAPTPVSQLLPQMTRIMAQGASGEEAAQLLALASEFAPGEEGTFVENTLKAINQNLVKGTAGEIGVTEGMTPLEQVKAAAGNLVGREAAGEDIKPMMAKMFNDIRESKGIKGFMNRGIRGKGFERVAGYIEDTPDDFTQTAIAEYQASDQGQYAQEEANLAKSQIERGERMKDVMLLRKQAEDELTGSGRFEETNLNDIGSSIMSAIPGIGGIVSDRRERLISEKALALAGDTSLTDMSSLTRGGADERIRQLLEEQNQMMQRDQQRPLVVRPPAPPTRNEMTDW